MKSLIFILSIAFLLAVAGAEPNQKVFRLVGLGDQSEKTIIDGFFRVVSLSRVAAVGKLWGSVPSDRHNQCANLSFADGHVEPWKWKSPKKHDAWAPAKTPKDQADLARLQRALPEP